MSEIVVQAGDAGLRLDVFLARIAGSRAAAQRWIDAGRVSVDGERRPKRHALTAGALVAIAPAAERTIAPQRPAARFTVAFSDPHLIVVDKPAGVVVHPGPGHDDGTLVQALAGQVAGGSDRRRPGVVHRLDRDTSGLLVFARDEPTHAALSALLARRAIVREYLALVRGRPPARTGTIDAQLGRDRRVRTRISTDTDGGRAAITHFEVERALAADTLLRVRLQTGRTHQIRAHLQAIGHPVAGDPEYGGGGQYGLARQFLHATRLAFDHPQTGAPIDITSPLPADLRAVLDALGEPA